MRLTRLFRQGAAIRQRSVRQGAAVRRSFYQKKTLLLPPYEKKSICKFR